MAIKKSTGLADYLRGKNIDKLYVEGLAGEVCVYFTSKDALDEGFATYLIEDATRPLDNDDFRETKNDIQKRGGIIVNSSKLD